MKIYTIQQSPAYHLFKTCERLKSAYFEEKEACKICIDETEDVLCSKIGPKWIGFIQGKVEYHDDECLCWVSHQKKERRFICRDCEKERIYEKDIKKALVKKEKEGNSKSSGSKET